MSLGPALVARLWRGLAQPAAYRFQRAIQAPEVTQRRVLARLMKAQAGTRFAREHGLSEGLSFEEFQRRVPVRSADDYAPWLAAVERGEPRVLTNHPVRALLPTSGSSAGRKLIPWTDQLGREFSAALGPWINDFMRASPEAWLGRAYWSVSPPAWPGERAACGLPIGFASDSAYVAAPLAGLIDRVLAVPPEVAQLTDADAWSYVTLAFLLRADDLSLVSVWSPTFLLALLAQLPVWWDRLLDDLATGQLHPPGHPPAPLLARLSARLGRHAGRARVLAHLGAQPDPKRIWPQWCAISCWCDASAQEPARRLAAEFPQVRLWAKGLLATEGVVSIPMANAPAPALALTSHLLEFVDEEGAAHGAWQLRAGQTYRVVLTTGGGLYRYDLGDQVRVAGFYHACPCVEFMGRAGVTSDLCGEKLAEPFVRRCLDEVTQKAGLELPFALVAPEEQGGQSGYALFYCTELQGEVAWPRYLAEQVELQLRTNVHYAHARNMGQLAPLRACRLAGSARQMWLNYQQRLMADGLRAGDIKPAALSSRTGWRAALVAREEVD